MVCDWSKRVAPVHPHQMSSPCCRVAETIVEVFSFHVCEQHARVLSVLLHSTCPSSGVTISCCPTDSTSAITLAAPSSVMALPRVGGRHVGQRELGLSTMATHMRLPAAGCQWPASGCRRKPPTTPYSMQWKAVGAGCRTGHEQSHIGRATPPHVSSAEPAAGWRLSCFARPPLSPPSAAVAPPSRTPQSPRSSPAAPQTQARSHRSHSSSRLRRRKRACNPPTPARCRCRHRSCGKTQAGCRAVDRSRRSPGTTSNMSVGHIRDNQVVGSCGECILTNICSGAANFCFANAFSAPTITIWLAVLLLNQQFSIGNQDS